jgi:L-fuconolactonase
MEAQMDPSADWLPQLRDAAAFWDAIVDTDAVVQTLIDVSQFDQLQTLVEAHPEVRYLVDHLGRMDPATDSAAAFDPLVEYENVLLKVSAVPFLSNESFPYRDVHGVLRTLLDTVGRERLAVGSDYPVMSMTATYGETLDWTEAVDWLSTGDRRWLHNRSIRQHCPHYR